MEKNECLKTLKTTKLKDFYEMQQLKSSLINMGIFFGKLYYSRNITFSLKNVENFIKGMGHNWRFKFQCPHSSCTTLTTYQKWPLICKPLVCADFRLHPHASRMENLLPEFFHTFSMALYHKWNVKNYFAYVLQFFSLISEVVCQNQRRIKRPNSERLHSACLLETWE